MDRYLCIHCHFYQPPRENPWLEIVELQDSAYPYHDWNERITAECYAPNAASRILDADGRIARIVNNYSRISFNFGPTLLSWMEDRAPDDLPGDARRRPGEPEAFLRPRIGHRAGLQPHDHAAGQPPRQADPGDLGHSRLSSIASAASPRACGWRKPRSTSRPSKSWPRNGIRFTVLAPSQAKRRRVTTAKFKNVEGGRIDPTRPYVCSLPSGRSIDLFFYDGPISQAVAFEGCCDGEHFANRLMQRLLPTDRRWKQLVHIATDGETYGHHHTRANGARLRAAPHRVATSWHSSPTTASTSTIQSAHARSGDRREHRLELRRTAWSDGAPTAAATPAAARLEPDHGARRCATRWTACATAWSSRSTRTKASELAEDPWLARDEYIDVVLDRRRKPQTQFLARTRGATLDGRRSRHRHYSCWKCSATPC